MEKMISRYKEFENLLASDQAKLKEIYDWLSSSIESNNQIQWVIEILNIIKNIVSLDKSFEDIYWDRWNCYLLSLDLEEFTDDENYYELADLFIQNDISDKQCTWWSWKAVTEHVVRRCEDKIGLLTLWDYVTQVSFRE